MSTTREIIIQHAFNFSKKKKGPVLILKAVFHPIASNPELDEVFVTHQWHGSGQVTKKEFSQLRDHLSKSKGWEVIALYVEQFVG